MKPVVARHTSTPFKFPTSPMGRQILENVSKEAWSNPKKEDHDGSDKT